MRMMAGLAGFTLLLLAAVSALYFGDRELVRFGNRKPFYREHSSGEVALAVAMTLIPGVVGLGCIGYAALCDD